MSKESQRLGQRLHNLLVNVARDGGRAERAIRDDDAVQLAVATLLDELCSIGCCGSDQVGEAAQGLPCLVCTWQDVLLATFIFHMAERQKKDILVDLTEKQHFRTSHGSNRCCSVVAINLCPFRCGC